MDATSGAVVIYDPELRMDLESLEKGVDVLRLRILKLLKDANLAEGVLDGVVLDSNVALIVLGININDLDSGDTVVQEIVAMFQNQQRLGFRDKSTERRRQKVSYALNTRP